MTEYRAQDILLAEDLMLLLLDDQKGTAAGEHVLTYILGGALLVELTLLGRADLEEKQGFLHSPKVLALGEGPLPDPLLQEAWDTIAEKPRGAQSLLAKVGKGLPKSIPARLVERGLVRQEKTRMLGLIPRTLHPAVDTSPGSREAAVRREVRAVLETPVVQQRPAALVALLSGSNTLKAALKDMDPPLPWSSDVRKRAKELQKGTWGARAVSDAITAIIAGAAAAAGAGAAAGS